jgi:AraC-like DNA-binding protein
MFSFDSVVVELLEVGRVQNPKGVKVVYPWEHGLSKPHSELWYVVQGEGMVRVDSGEWQPIRCGMLVWFRSNRFYEWRQNPHKPLAVYFFHFHVFDRGRQPVDDSLMPETIDCGDPVFAESISRRILELHWEVYHQLTVLGGLDPRAAGGPRPRFEHESEHVRHNPFLPKLIGITVPSPCDLHPVLVQALRLFHCLIDEYQRLACNKRSLDAVGLQLFHRQTIQGCAAAIQQDLAAVPSVSELARRCGYGLDHFGRVFHKVMGCGPQEFIIRVRIAQARHLLRESAMSIKQIASALGYSNPCYFSRQFRSITGESPSSFREGVR